MLPTRREHKGAPNYFQNAAGRLWSTLGRVRLFLRRVEDHPECSPILDRASGVEPLELAPDLDIGGHDASGNGLQTNHRRPPHPRKEGIGWSGSQELWKDRHDASMTSSKGCASEDAGLQPLRDAGRVSRSGPRHVGTDTAAAAVMGAGVAVLSHVLFITYSV